MNLMIEVLFSFFLARFRGVPVRSILSNDSFYRFSLLLGRYFSWHPISSNYFFSLDNAVENIKTFLANKFDVNYSEHNYYYNIVSCGKKNTLDRNCTVYILKNGTPQKVNFSDIPQRKMVELYIPASLGLRKERLKYTHKAVNEFFISVCKALQEEEYSVLPRLQIINGFYYPSNLPKISYHSYSKTNNILGKHLHFKESSHPHFFSVDRLGYAGWSSVSKMTIDQMKTTLFLYEKKGAISPSRNIEKLSIKLRESTKYPGRDNSIKFNLGTGFILVPLQVISDSVSANYHFSVKDFLREVLNLSKSYSGKIFIKRHPLCRSRYIEDWLRRNTLRGSSIETVSGDIIPYLSSCNAVLTMNSGVGFEALLWNKKVFSCGISDYSSCATEIKTSDKLVPTVLYEINKSNDTERTKIFLDYYFNIYCSRDLKRMISEIVIH